jgi:hypoxanthine phosphoribosyltransferase
MSVVEIGWGRYGELVEMLVTAVNVRHRTAEFADVVVISHGGMLPAAAIVHALPQLRLHYWEVKRFAGMGVGAPRGEAVIRLSPTPFKGPRVSGAGVLIVDGVVDEGTTSAAALDRVEQYAQVAKIPPPRQIVIACLIASVRHRARIVPEGDLIAANWKASADVVRLPYEI